MASTINKSMIVGFGKMKTIANSTFKIIDKRAKAQTIKNKDTTTKVNGLNLDKSSSSTSSIKIEVSSDSSSSVTQSARAKKSSQYITHSQESGSVKVREHKNISDKKTTTGNSPPARNLFKNQPNSINQLKDENVVIHRTPETRVKKVNTAPEGNEGMDNDSDNSPRLGRQKSGQALNAASSASSSPRQNLDSTSSSSGTKPKALEGDADGVNTISRSNSASDPKTKGIVSFRDLKRTLTKKLSSVKLNQTVNANKKARSPESMQKSDAQKAISALPADLRFNFARELNDFKNTEEYKIFSEKTKPTSIFLKAGLFLHEMGLEFNNDELQKALLKDAGKYKKQIIDLRDPVYVGHVQQSLEAEIKGAWNNLNVEAKTPYEKLVEEDKICRVFSRDFDHSHYYVKQSNGETKKIDSMDHYVNFASNGVITDMPRIISVLSSQSFGIFLRNALFNRKSTSHTRFEFGSALTLSNGIPVSPQNTRGVGNDISYTMEKKSDGSFVVEYTRALYAKPGNPILVRAIDLGAKTYALRDDCFIQIYAPITIQPDGKWEIGNVELQTFNIEEAPTQQ